MLKATNGFHDTANAVATVVHTNAIRPTQAATCSGPIDFVAESVGPSALICVLGALLFHVVIPTPALNVLGWNRP